VPSRQVFGYVNLPAQRADVEGDVDEARRAFADFAAREGYDLAAVYTDVGDHAAGLDTLVGEVRRQDVAAVLVPDLDQLTHVPWLAGADLPTAARCLGTKVVPMRQSGSDRA
jgi:hypothetical protein